MVSGLAVRSHVQWPKTYRIIRSIYPPIDLFEDIADPATGRPLWPSRRKRIRGFDMRWAILERCPRTAAFRGPALVM